MNGPLAILVTKSSASHCRHWEDGAEHLCPIARSHSDMVKFAAHDDEYDRVLEKLKGLARRARQKGSGDKAVDQPKKLAMTKGNWEDTVKTPSCG
jgi:hypothetical protein